MSKEVIIGNKKISDSSPCFIIAEIGINHNGFVDLAKKMIDEAVMAGCDAVKFQKRTVTKVYSPQELDVYRPNYYGSTNRDLKNGLELSYEDYQEIINLKPDLIVMDGGKLQISVAKEIIDSLGLNIPIIGLVKDNNHKTSYIMNDKYEILEVSKDSNLFLFFTRIQEEVHRYAITYHRNIKAKGMLSSVLDVVPGIGEVRKKELLKRFGSLKRLKEASVEELSEVVSKEVAKNLATYLKEL